MIGSTGTIANKKEGKRGEERRGEDREKEKERHKA
jgi:hypothetical protein